jgi:hypothetical protein
MSVATVQFTSDGNKIHSGPAFPFINILRPGYGMRPLFTGNPPLYSDPADPVTWASATAFDLGVVVFPVTLNGYAYRAIAVTGTGTSGGTEPVWPTVIGGTVIDNAGVDQITWMNVGPLWKWKASSPAFTNQEITDASGNKHIALNGGTTGSGVEPTWSTVFGAIDNDNGVLWMNLGPTLSVGAVTGDIVFDVTATMMEADVDQYTSPLRKDVTKEVAKITGTLRQLELSVVKLSIPNAAYSSGTETAFPTGVQTFEESGFGGQLNVITPCVAIVSPRPNVPNSYFRAWLNKCAPSGAGSWPFSLKKYSDYKVDWEGMIEPTYPAGYQIGRLVKN